MHELIYDLLFNQRYLGGIMAAAFLMNKSDWKKELLTL